MKNLLLSVLAIPLFVLDFNYSGLPRTAVPDLAQMIHSISQASVQLNTEGLEPSYRYEWSWPKFGLL